MNELAIFSAHCEDADHIGESVILLHVRYGSNTQLLERQAEFRELASGVGSEIVGELIISLHRQQHPHPHYFIGSGKLQQLQQEVVTKKVSTVFIDHPLLPRQQSNLEQHLKVRVLDRTALILDIFARRAHSHEGKLQVELARLEYIATRLVRGWSHLERQRGGIGLRGGPGEKQLESDRRILRRHISDVKKRLMRAQNQRNMARRNRKKSNKPIIALAGYTNAGKSSLFNTLTRERAYVAAKVFATLDTTMRKMFVPNLGEIILVDTVGFMRDLPHNLIEAFKGTLEETVEADLLLHVIDCNQSNVEERIEIVEQLLEEVGANAPCLRVYNKVDKLLLTPRLIRDQRGYPTEVSLSATQPAGIDLLKTAIAYIFRLNQH